MKKRIITLAVVAALAVTLFAACGKKTVTVAQAQEIALKELNKTAAQVDDIHYHMAEIDGTACYEIHITIGDENHYVYVDSTGKVVGRK